MLIMGISFQNKPSLGAVSLLTRMLKIEPTERIQCWDALGDTFFDELRNAKFPRGGLFPDLFNFTPEELNRKPSINHLIVPSSNVKVIKRTIGFIFHKTQITTNFPHPIAIKRGS